MSEMRPSVRAPAFRQALTDRLKMAAREGPWSLQQLQRQMAYDRLLERLYLEDRGWILKGATALLARGLGVRATIDIDVFRDASPEIAEAELRRAAARDIGDWFRFDVGGTRALADAAGGARLPITAFIGLTPWAMFHVDLVGAEVRMTGEPDDVPALARVRIPQLQQHGYRAYPLVDHIADKVSAICGRYGQAAHPSTRFKDLVDLVAIVTRASVEVEAQMGALGSQAERRGITFPERFDVPDRQRWEGGYAAEAGRSLLPAARTLDEALDVVRPFLNPLLARTAAGSWNPATQIWASSLKPDGRSRTDVTRERAPGMDVLTSRRSPHAGSSFRVRRDDRGLGRSRET